jgi:Arc/MetJ-type ribon-helix-helix transcriptional regulator
MEKQISIRLPEDLLDRLDRVAAETGRKRSGMVRRALYAYLDGRMVEPDESPIDRVRDLVGVAYGGPRDLGRRHREHLRDLIVDRRG